MIYIDARLPLVTSNAAYRKTAYAFYMTAAGKAFKERLAFEAKKAMRGQKRLDGPVKVLVDYWFATERNDIDGCVKLTLDALNGIVWGDDRQVMELSVGKHKAKDRKHVGLAMTIHELEVEREVSEI